MMTVIRLGRKPRSRNTVDWIAVEYLASKANTVQPATAIGEAERSDPLLKLAGFSPPRMAKIRMLMFLVLHTAAVPHAVLSFAG